MKKIDFKKRSTWFALLGIAASIGLICFLWNVLYLGYSAEDRLIARNLAAISGLSKSDVFHLYDARGSWEPVKENIFVYKKILGHLPNGFWSGRKTYGLIKIYETGDILATTEFVSNYGSDYSQVEELLKQHAQGRSLEDIFACTVSSKAYAAYQPGGREQIRQWLAAGYQPQDIINADAIAMAKDMPIDQVLAMKTSATRWEAIAKSLNYELKSGETMAVVTLPSNESATSASDYESIVKEANQKAEQNKTLSEQALAQDLGLSSKQMAEYKDRGFTFRDIQNAYRLARDTGTDIEQIFQERATSEDWKDIIARHSQQGNTSHE